ncbi:PrtD family type I secretion system ABC transporter [Skermanella aerolata]|uniref:type I secretion system permease/ATPase n=1 Tax=Skermanella aerolata TaxID=393310 RepID=UPI003D224C04
MSQDNVLSDALSRCRRALTGVMLFSAVLNVLMLTSSVYMLQVYDRVLSSGSIETLLYLTIIAALALLLLSLLDTLRSRMLDRVSTWLERRVGPFAFRRALDASLSQRDYQGESLRDLGAVRTFLGSGIATLFDVPWVPVYLAVVYLLHPLMGHVALAGAVILFLLALASDLAARRPLREANRSATRSMRTVDGALRNAEAIDAMGLTDGVLRRWAGLSHGALSMQSLASDRAAAIQGAAKFVRLFVQTAILGVGAWLVIRQEVSGGAMIAGSIIMGRALAPVEQAIGTWKQMIQAREAYKRLAAFLALPPLRAEAMPLPAPEGRLSVEGVCFGLQGKPLILKSVSFKADPGEAVCIIGPSAAGKSSLARLLVGVRSPQTGIVRLDGADIFSWPKSDLGRHVGYLPQDVELFSGTIRENIARLEEADPANVVAAARMANCYDMILKLENGYDTEIGEAGVRLSGGQRQRIALARAVFGRPRLVILDEPNASLDGEGEEALNRAIAALKASGSTVIVIGHRPSLLQEVTKVLVLVAGQVEMFGPRAEVMDRLTRRNVQPVAAGSPARAQAAAGSRSAIPQAATPTPAE